ncbi:MAG: hypothetical protein ACYSSP_10765 [Planctomycetota bacterium]|jgi:hypothetical protein
MMNITKILENLSNERPVFHSEADFQHSFAWHIHKILPDAKIRLEYPVDVTEDGRNYRLYLDVWLDINEATYGIELKYKTVKLNHSYKGENFILKNQAAEDTGRYDFLKDAQRLETLVQSQTIASGYALLLTNAHLYWTPPARETVDKDFRIHENRKIFAGQELQWTSNASKGTTDKREEPIVMKKNYNLFWKTYSNLAYQEHTKGTEFKVLVLKLG